MRNFMTRKSAASGLFLTALLIQAGPALASGERELASEGDDVRLTIADDFQCGPNAEVEITTQSAGYFDQGAATIQRLADVSRAVLGFECTKITQITFSGFTDGVQVFQADAGKASKWALQSYPAPLEILALFLSLREPDFFYLGTINAQLKPYLNVTGIKDSYQLQALEKQAKRLAAIANGDTEAFIAYLESPAHDFKNYEEASRHFADILEAIEKYARGEFPAYRMAYEETEDSLKDAFWSSRIASLIGEDKNVAQMVDDAAVAARDAGSNEFAEFIDTRIAAWVQEDVDLIALDTPEAPLYEIALVADHLAAFPDPSRASGLPRTAEVLRAGPGQLLPVFEERLQGLVSLAGDTIEDAGSAYTDVDAVLETGFALAEEFEDAGFADESEALIAGTFDHIDNILIAGLPTYKEELAGMRFTSETVAALQEQALVFEELSTEFPAFKPYQQAAEGTLTTNKRAICEGILREHGIDEDDFQKSILVGEVLTTLVDFSCQVFEGQQQVTGFDSKGWSGSYVMTITDSEGEASQFLLQPADGAKDALRFAERLDSEDSEAADSDLQAYVARLIEPPPSGKPDANGVRACDRLGADPDDANKLAAGIDMESDELDSDTFDRALDACIAAVEDAPDDPRQQYQLGRLLWYAGDADSAREFIDSAAASNYAPALYYKAEILLSTSEDDDAFIDALDLYEKAGNAGYARGAAMVKELNPDGIDFFKEIPPPTGREIVNALELKGGSVAMFGMSSSVEVADVKVKDCFQTSATDFSCEYRKILECRMYTGSNNPWGGLMKWAMQKDCNATEYTFGTFRKLAEEKWRELPSDSN